MKFYLRISSKFLLQEQDKLRSLQLGDFLIRLGASFGVHSIFQVFVQTFDGSPAAFHGKMFPQMVHRLIRA